ncbi:hypothetical protein [Paraburkholderia nodosa]|uniref:hypothetical protein n=1 Tax=Paraburkholderia nodosa TaxID=392320 RepID=UPI0008415BEF|nr:hypothetical protein [Paraburkholderia nodosa]
MAAPSSDTGGDGHDPYSLPDCHRDFINRATPGDGRGGTLSALYLLGYLAAGILAPILGRVATVHGLGFAVYLGAGVIAALSFATLALALGLRRIAKDERR